MSIRIRRLPLWIHNQEGSLVPCLVACPRGWGGGHISHGRDLGGVICSMFGEVTCPMVGLGLKYLN